MIMQCKSYPLPPLFLTEIIERCRVDHTHICDDICLDHAGMHRFSQEHSCDMVPTIVSIKEGNGRHVHEESCKWRDCDRFNKATQQWETVIIPHDCSLDCDDSDWIVELCYHSNGYHAVYGIKRKGDVQDVSLWMD
jgi:hypothetical protein